MDLIDLHVHTTASDGSLSPIEIVDLAVLNGLSAIAITDHDTIDGLNSAMPYSKAKGLELISGIELSCYYNNREIHILGLFVDYKNEDLKKELIELKEFRRSRNIKMIELMQEDGINITLDKLLHGNPDSVITRAHFARVLVEEGVCKDKDIAFKKYIGVGCKYYLPKPQITCELAMSILSRYCKASFLAHPLLYKLGYTQLEQLLDHLIPLGLRGLEAYHSSNNAFESEKLRSLANQYNLLVSGGSDYHGIIKPNIQIGSGRGGMKIPYQLLERIKTAIY